MSDKVDYNYLYKKYKNKYLLAKKLKDIKGGDDIQWGIGIEHELAIFNGIQYYILGSEILDNIKNEQNDYIEIIKSKIKKDKEYKIYEYSNHVSDMNIYLHNINSYNYVISRPDFYSKLRVELFKIKNLDPEINSYFDNILKKNKNELDDNIVADTDIDFLEFYISLRDVVESCGIDTNLNSDVIEYITSVPLNRNIDSYIEEIILKQKIIKILHEDLFRTKIVFPSRGSIFPVKEHEKSDIYLDYTGSYHLNLSLPYSKQKIEEQRIIYNNSIESWNKIVDDFTNFGSNNEETVRNLFNIKVYDLLELLKGKIDTTKLFDFDKRVIEFETFLKSVRSLLEVNFFEKIRLILGKRSIHFRTNFIGFKLDENKVKFTEIFLNNKIFNLLSDIKDIEIDNRNIEDEEKFSDKEYDDFKSKLFEFFSEEIYERIKTSIKRKLNSVFYNLITYNKNLELDKSDFKNKNKTWGLMIQWLIPLILSCYSSADPFSVGDNMRLSELSLRLFISGYSFINNNDIKNLNFPNSRSTYDFQDEGKIKSLVEDEFDYSKERFNGSEFRSDDKRGFDFGFELRIFDNFGIEHLKQLLELIFLIADNMHEQEISSDIIENPFNNDILNHEIIKILKEGWNTNISLEYKELINKNLFPKSPINFGNNNIAYDVINLIYKTLQRKFIIGKNGEYSKYVIKRRNFIDILPNLNLKSWNYAFEKTVLGKDEEISNKIQKVIKNFDYKISQNYQPVKDKLKEVLPDYYYEEIDDIISYYKGIKKIP